MSKNSVNSRVLKYLNVFRACVRGCGFDNLSGLMKRIETMLLVVLVHLLFSGFGYAETKEAGPFDMKLQKAYHSMLMADQARDKGDLTAAIDSYSDALEIYNDLSMNYPNEQTETVKFRTIYCNNQMEEMLKEVDRAKVIKKKTATVKESSSGDKQKVNKLIDAARVYIQNGNPEKAHSVLMGALSLDPDNSDLRLLMGVAQCQAGKHKDALYVLKYLVEEEPRNVKALMALGTAYLAMNDAGSALRSMERALAVDSKNPEVNFNMSQLLLVVDPPNPEEAVKYYKEAIRLGSEPDAELERELKKF